MTPRTFTTTLEPRRGGGVTVRLPFDPAAAWGDKDRHYVTGSIEGCGLRGALTPVGETHELRLGPAWCRGAAVAPGARVSVTLEPEGPQLDTMDGDVVAALTAEPEAARFFESLATFYRRGFIESIERAKRPETRARRIAEMVAALMAGRREP
jgi:hypothetical protein